MENSHKKTNRLINSLSPYLIQHAHNPVDWHEWGEEAFEKARTENKLLLASIGYSACHWCHVMAHECFEDEETAAMMNDYFVCIKIDREELPDIDQVYMNACQLVNGSGGWPLNAFALPDKRPFHALTYAPKAKWKEIIHGIWDLWNKEPGTVLEFAEKLSKGIANMSLPPQLTGQAEAENISDEVLATFTEQYDEEFGGPNRAPKFPMPSNYIYLLKHGVLYNNENAVNMGLFTLKQMALGGIHDIVGGGFARYSVDARWFAPHFEKMLYDNAQLVSLYSYAFKVSGNDLYRDTALRILSFCSNEMKAENGLYYSAYDADSEGMEGYYYTYTYPELASVLGEDTSLFCNYFQCTEAGNWEHGRNILFAIDTVENAVNQSGSDVQAYGNTIRICLEKLKHFRDHRVKPGLDDKCICSWNNLMLKGLAEASMWLGEPQMAKDAEDLAKKILDTFHSSEGLKRIAKKGSVKIDAFLEDHATLIDGLIAVYQATFNEEYLLKAEELCRETIMRFYNRRNRFFEFNNNDQDAIIAPKYDTNDDVICSGNSIMAHNLWRLSWYFDNMEWLEMAKTMLGAMTPHIQKSAPWYSNWATLQLFREEGTIQIILSGDEVIRNTLPLNKHYYIPNAIFGFAGKASSIPLFKGKEYNGIAMVYRCKNQVCELPEPF